jgi:hypothetical protein
VGGFLPQNIWIAERSCSGRKVLLEDLRMKPLRMKAMLVCAVVALSFATPAVFGETLVYENSDPCAMYLPPGDNGFTMIADDMNLAGTERELIRYSFDVNSPPGTAPYSVVSELYTDTIDPCTGYSIPDSPIPGTFCGHFVINDGYLTLNCTPLGATLPDRVWMVLSFDDPLAGWQVSGPAEVGETGDTFGLHDGVKWDAYWFGGDPHAGFTARIWSTAVKEPVPHLKWSQPPIEWDPNDNIPTYCGWDEVSYNRDDQNPSGPWRIVADDFRCLGTMPVDSIHWWGSFFDWEWSWAHGQLPDDLPIAWQFGFWSNVPAGYVTDYSFPEVLLWQVEVDATRVEMVEVGKDDYHGWYPYDICYQLYVDLWPEEVFWQHDFLDQTMGDVFWLSITAIYEDTIDPPYNPWGWKTRPWSWMDDAVVFELPFPPDVGMALDPVTVVPIEDPILGESFDVAFELDTDLNWIKWEQPFTGIRHWPHYEDELSIVKPPEAVIKWEQPVDPLLSGLHSHDSQSAGGPYTWVRLADDWQCGGGDITDIHWWGGYESHGLGIKEFHLSIHSCDTMPTPWHLPLEPAVWEANVPFNQVNETDTGLVNNIGYPIYSYEYYLPDPYPQIQGEYYWVDIMAISEDPVWPNTALWYWMESDRSPTILGHAPAAERTDGTPWRSIVWPGFPDERYSDMAFAITSGESGEPNLVRLVADDWLCERMTPITACVWWGSYIGYQYAACDVEGPWMNLPIKPDYFRLSVWTDVPAGTDLPYSHPGDIIWEYDAYDYDEVLVGYDKHPEDEIGPPREPVFRYSVKLPDWAWFHQEAPDTVYWFSVVAVYDQRQPNYDWGWTNHEKVFNDDAVAGHQEVTGEWIWQELFDQTGESEDMSFILFTEPEEPTCWDNITQCAGQTSGDGTCDGNINLADLFALKAYFGSCAPWTAPECCSDYNQSGCVNLGDLFILKAGFSSGPYVPSTGNQNCP